MRGQASPVDMKRAAGIAPGMAIRSSGGQLHSSESTTPFQVVSGPRSEGGDEEFDGCVWPRLAGPGYRR